MDCSLLGNTMYFLKSFSAFLARGYLRYISRIVSRGIISNIPYVVLDTIKKIKKYKGIMDLLSFDSYVKLI